MKRLIIQTFLGTMLLSCTTSDNKKPSATFRVPAEFEPQEAIWLGFDSNREDGYFKEDTYKILYALNPNTNINLVIEHDSLLPQGKLELHELGLDTSKIQIIIQEPTDSWYRDNGPIFGIDEKGELTVLGFQNRNEDLKDNRKDIAQRMNVKYIETDIVMDGGSFESNGQGTVILCEAVTLRQNPELTKQEIETELKNKFDIETVVWMKRGVDPYGSFANIIGKYYGRGTGGHTDEFVRFANDSTILLSWISEEEAKNHIVDSMLRENLIQNYRVLENVIDHRGKTFSIVKVPHPNPDPSEWVFEYSEDSHPVLKEEYLEGNINDGDTLYWLGARSYLNYLITDDFVLIPEYWEVDKPKALQEEDEQAMKIFETTYPNREIIGVPLDRLKWVGGGIHCRYQSEPMTK